jgi:hypothetical protein
MRFHAESKKHTQSENIEYLLNIKFPGGLHPQPLRSSPNSSSDWPSASRLEQIKAERERLSKLSSIEIGRLYAIERGAKYEQAKKELFFNQSAANADFDSHKTANEKSGSLDVASTQEWTLTKPQRFQGYGKPLYDLLKKAYDDGLKKPTARDVIDAWRVARPLDVTEISDAGLKYLDANGNTKPADLDAIRNSIKRMTTTKADLKR